MANLSRALLTALKAHGAGEIFGIPGDFVLPFFREVETSGILPYYTLSHEPAVGFAADAAARFRGGVGVAVVTYGAGAFNVVNSVAGAYAERSPVVVVAGAPGANERTSGFLLHHQARTVETQLAIFREVTCDQAVLDDAAKAPAAIARVLRNAVEHSLPVYLELPRDMTFAEVADVPALPRRAGDAEALAECAEEVLERLANATSPVILVDVDVRRYGCEGRVAKLAEMLGIPVVTTFLGRGLMSDAPGVNHGTYLGVAGDAAVSRLVEDSDALLLLGVVFCDTNFAVSERRLDLRRAVLAIDRSVRVGHHAYDDLPLEDVLDALIARAKSGGRAAIRPAAPARGPRGLIADGGALVPTDVARAVNDHFDRHGTMPMAADMGDCLFTATEIENAELVAPAYYAGMGFGVPAGLGLGAATGRRPLILVGDGAFQMTGWELGNCRRYGWAPIVVLFNNQSWEMLRAFMPDARFNDLDDWHFADIAASLGGVGERVSTRGELQAALARAGARTDRFSLIEVMLPRGATSDTLAKFVNRFKSTRDGTRRG